MERKADFKLKAYLNLEQVVQNTWQQERVFEANGLKSNRDKFFVSFPYPYMNGQLHIGHAFSLSKAEVSNCPDIHSIFPIYLPNSSFLNRLIFSLQHDFND